MNKTLKKLASIIISVFIAGPAMATPRAGLMVNGKVMTAPTLKTQKEVVDETPRERSFHIEPTINGGANSLGEGVYFSFGQEARFKTGIIAQSYKTNYSDQDLDGLSHELSIGYFKIPVLLEINNPSSPQYTQFGVFFATPFDSKLDGVSHSGINNLFGAEVETGFVWRFEVVSLKLGIQSVLSFNSIASSDDLPNKTLFQFNVTSGISFSM